MSRVRFTKISQPANPPSNTAELFYSTTDSKLEVVDASGNVLKLGGFVTLDFRLIKVTNITTTGTSTYTPSTGVRALYVEAIGGGAQGGGAATSSSQVSVGSGGGAGAYSAAFLTGASVKASYSVTIGTGGSGAAAGANGNAGADTTFDSPSTVTAKAGAGGIAMAAGTTVLDQVGGAGGAAGSGVGDLVISGAQGSTAIRYSSTQGQSGEGGASVIIGAQAPMRIAVAGGIAGTAATNYGGGGSGAATTTTSAAGGAGAQGLIRVWELA